MGQNVDRPVAMKMAMLLKPSLRSLHFLRLILSSFEKINSVGYTQPELSEVI